MATSNVLVIRYSDALFQSCKDKGLLEKVESELESVHSAATTAGIVSKLLMNACVPIRIKKPLLDNITKNMKLSDVSQNFIKQLVKNNRINLLGSIIRSYKELSLAEKGVVSAHLRCAVKLDDAILQKVKKELESSLKKTVQLTVIEDKSTLGGFSIIVGSKSIDCTLKSKLSKIKQHLAAVEF